MEELQQSMGSEASNQPPITNVINPNDYTKNLSCLRLTHYLIKALLKPFLTCNGHIEPDFDANIEQVFSIVNLVGLASTYKVKSSSDAIYLYFRNLYPKWGLSFAILPGLSRFHLVNIEERDKEQLAMLENRMETNLQSRPSKRESTGKDIRESSSQFEQVSQANTSLQITAPSLIEDNRQESSSQPDVAEYQGQEESVELLHENSVESFSGENNEECLDFVLKVPGNQWLASTLEEEDTGTHDNTSTNQSIDPFQRNPFVLRNYSVRSELANQSRTPDRLNMCGTFTNEPRQSVGLPSASQISSRLLSTTSVTLGDDLVDWYEQIFWELEEDLRNERRRNQTSLNPASINFAWASNILPSYTVRQPRENESFYPISGDLPPVYSSLI
ncbi:hypothetical protein KGF57_004058 [Candida theae]|uniref:Uncharacterized protein n=1 Tax=Candida theae TaxID=1198502 RepID=A0AAD5BBY2_9ASCO|nr:uncharacterized protein KGF57_004058 [Candida theae]KAI5953066.1 hypothetical protein KGF57_004058 [Candida theae]